MGYEIKMVNNSLCLALIFSEGFPLFPLYWNTKAQKGSLIYRIPRTMDNVVDWMVLFEIQVSWWSLKPYLKVYVSHQVLEKVAKEYVSAIEINQEYDLTTSHYFQTLTQEAYDLYRNQTDENFKSLFNTVVFWDDNISADNLFKLYCMTYPNNTNPIEIIRYQRIKIINVYVILLGIIGISIVLQIRLRQRKLKNKKNKKLII